MPVAWDFAAFAIAVAGLMLGSFATVLVARIPEKIGIVVSDDKYKAARSVCPSCGHVLSSVDLIPLLSWLWQRGRCRYCHACISWRYPAIELSCMFACLGVYAVYGATFQAFALIAAIPFLLALFVIDMDHMILPDKLLVAVFVCMVFFVGASLPLQGGGLEQALATHIGGAVLFGGGIWLLGRVVSALVKRDALGFGDVKFFALAGFALGAASFPYFLLVSGVAGLVLGGLFKLYASLRHQEKKDAAFPFGPALIVSFYCLLIVDGAQSWHYEDVMSLMSFGIF